MSLNKLSFLFKNQNRAARSLYQIVANYSSSNESSKIEELNESLSKYNLALKNFTTVTQQRLKQVNVGDLTNIMKNLSDYGVDWKRTIETLEQHDDWSIFSRENLCEKFEFFRQLGFTTEITSFLIARNAEVMDRSEGSIKNNYKQLKEYFSTKQLTSLLVKSPKLLTSDLFSFQYKFTYLYVLMGIQQIDMCTSFVFNQSIDHIRERHLFLQRAGLYDKPNKKGETKVENPFLKDIVDSSIGTYLKLTTKDQFTVDDYETFCEYLKKEDFTDELLGFNIGHSLQDQIIKQVRRNTRWKKYENSVK